MVIQDFNARGDAGRPGRIDQANLHARQGHGLILRARRLHAQYGRPFRIPVQRIGKRRAVRVGVGTAFVGLIKRRPAVLGLAPSIAEAAAGLGEGAADGIEGAAGFRRGQRPAGPVAAQGQRITGVPHAAAGRQAGGDVVISGEDGGPPEAQVAAQVDGAEFTDRNLVAGDKIAADAPVVVEAEHGAVVQDGDVRAGRQRRGYVVQQQSAFEVIERRVGRRQIGRLGIKVRFLPCRAAAFLDFQGDVVSPLGQLAGVDDLFAGFIKTRTDQTVVLENVDLGGIGQKDHQLISEADIEIDTGVRGRRVTGAEDLDFADVVHRSGLEHARHVALFADVVLHKGGVEKPFVGVGVGGINSRPAFAPADHRLVPRIVRVGGAGRARDRAGKRRNNG